MLNDMRKVLRFTLALCCLTVFQAGCGAQEKKEIISNAYDVVLQQTQGSYTPDFKVDGKDTKVRNIILMIGDGMGLGAAANAYFANGKELTMMNLKTKGYVCTQSASDFITDSAASGTAYATGQKTTNGHVGTDVNQQPVKNLPEKLAPLGYACGVVSTDDLHGATPASFFAHQNERGASQEIWEDLPGCFLTFASAGTKGYFENLPLSDQEAIKKTFTLVYSPDDPAVRTSSRLIYLPESVKYEERGNYLPATTEMAINYLSSKSKKGFFLMVEGARIDKEEHGNNAAGVVRETLDFDKAIEAAVRFAEKDGHTLVVISADHETGTTAIRNAVLEENTVQVLFSSKGHSGIMVPLYAYGPKSWNFEGIQENSDVSNKIYNILK